MVETKSMSQAVFLGAVLASNCVRKHEYFFASGNWTLFLFGCFLIVGRVAVTIYMIIPSDVRIFIWNETNSSSTEGADEHSDVHLIRIRAHMLYVASVLQTEHFITSIAGEG